MYGWMDGFVICIEDAGATVDGLRKSYGTDGDHGNKFGRSSTAHSYRQVITPTSSEGVANIEGGAASCGQAL